MVMTPRIELEQEPALDELVESNTISPALLGYALAEFLATPGVSGWFGSAQLMPMLQLGGSRRAIAEVRDYVHRKLTGRRAKILAREEVPIELGCYWVDLPAVDGAKASIKISTKTSRKVAAKLRVAGIGGGGGATITLNGGIGSEAEKPETLICRVPAIVEKVEVSRRGVVEAVFDRVTKYFKGHEEWTSVPLKMPVPGLGPVTQTFTWTRSASPGVFTKPLEIVKGTSWEFSSKLSVDKIKFEAGLSITGSYEVAVKYNYTLPKAHTYVGSTHASCPGFFWRIG
jgi:hypothetical protein